MDPVAAACVAVPPGTLGYGTTGAAIETAAQRLAVELGVSSPVRVMSYPISWREPADGRRASGGPAAGGARVIVR